MHETTMAEGRICSQRNWDEGPDAANSYRFDLRLSSVKVWYQSPDRRTSNQQRNILTLNSIGDLVQQPECAYPSSHVCSPCHLASFLFCLSSQRKPRA